jgi:hypothetical protein
MMVSPEALTTETEATDDEFKERLWFQSTSGTSRWIVCNSSLLLFLLLLSTEDEDDEDDDDECCFDFSFVPQNLTVLSAEQVTNEPEDKYLDPLVCGKNTTSQIHAR